jgi:hypothetical protein
LQHHHLGNAVQLQWLLGHGRQMRHRCTEHATRRFAQQGKTRQRPPRHHALERNSCDSRTAVQPVTNASERRTHETFTRSAASMDQWSCGGG